MKRRNIFLIFFLAYTSIYVARLNLSIAGSGMMECNILDAAKLGLLGSVFSIVYSVGRLVNGTVSDTTPPWKMITCGLIVAGISNICVGFFPPYAGIFFLWTANAFAQSMLWSSVMCVVTSIYNKRESKTKMSIMVTSVAVGNILGIVINTFLITEFGLRYAFFVPGIITVILAFAVFLSTRNIDNRGKEKTEHMSILELVKNRELLKMSFPAMFHGVMKENVSLWMSVYIIDKYAVDLTTSSYYILLIPAIGFIGRVTYSFILKAFKNDENKVSAAGFVICTAASVILCVSKIGILSAVLALGIIYTAVSIINTSIVTIYPLNYVKSNNSASVSGLMDFATYLGGGISGACYGIIIKYFGYFAMFASWAVLSVAALVILRNIKNSCK